MKYFSLLYWKNNNHRVYIIFFFYLQILKMEIQIRIIKQTNRKNASYVDIFVCLKYFIYVQVCVSVVVCVCCWDPMVLIGSSERYFQGSVPSTHHFFTCRKIRPTRPRDEPTWSLPEGLATVIIRCSYCAWLMTGNHAMLTDWNTAFVLGGGYLRLSSLLN